MKKKRSRIKNTICSDLEEYFRDLKDKRIPLPRKIVGNRTKCSLGPEKHRYLIFVAVPFCRGAMEGTGRPRTSTASLGRSSRRGGVNDEERCSGRSGGHQFVVLIG